MYMYLVINMWKAKDQYSVGLNVLYNYSSLSAMEIQMYNWISVHFGSKETRNNIMNMRVTDRTHFYINTCQYITALQISNLAKIIQ